MSLDTLFHKFGKEYNNKDIIFEQGREGNEVFLIQEGTVKISKVVEKKEYTVTYLKKPEFFGEMALITEHARSATAVAVGHVKLLSFNRENFETMIKSNAQLAVNIITMLCVRLRIADHHIEALNIGNNDDIIKREIYFLMMENTAEESKIDREWLVKSVAFNRNQPENLVSEIVETLLNDHILQTNLNGMMNVRDWAKFKRLNFDD